MKRRFYISLILLCGIVMQAFPQSMTISGGAEYGVVICAKGLVYAWGANPNNVLGLDAPYSTTNPVTTPRPVKMPTFSNGDPITFNQVVAGSGAFTVGLSCTGVVYCWGSNANGEGGQGAYTPAVITQPTPVKCGAAPGYTEEGVPGGPYLGGVKYVAATTGSVYAILKNGEVLSWGSNKNDAGNNSGQLANGTNNNSNLPGYVLRSAGNRLTNVTHVAGGDYTVYFVAGADNTVYSAGGWVGRPTTGAGNVAANYAGPVRKGTVVNNNPQITPDILKNVSMTAAGDVHGIAVDENGEVWGWGNNYWGCCAGLGNWNLEEYALPVEAGAYGTISGEDNLTNVVEVIGGRGYSAAVTKEGYVLYWGNVYYQKTSPYYTNQGGNGGYIGNPTYNATSSNAGYNIPPEPPEYNTCADGPQFLYYCTPARRVDDAVHLARGDNFGFMVNNKNQYYTWGRNDVGQLGVGDRNNRNCLVEMTIPCYIADPMPEVALANSYEKCLGKAFPLDCRFTPPIGKESLYSYTWYREVGGVKTELTGAQYTTQVIQITEAGRYWARVNYLGGNVPCTAVDFSEGSTIVTDKETPIDTLITTSCVSPDALALTGTDRIRFEFNSKYAAGYPTATAPAKGTFTVYQTETSTVPLATVECPITNPKGTFTVAGNYVTVNNNSPKDTTYNIWIEDVTTRDMSLYEGKTLPNSGSPQSYALLIECWSDVYLKDLSVQLKSYYGSATTTAQVIIYSATKNNNGQYVPGAVYKQGSPNQLLTFLDGGDGTLCRVPAEIQLTGNPTKGALYFIGITFSSTNFNCYMFPVTHQANSPLFVTPVGDNLTGTSVIAVGATQNSYNNSANPADYVMFTSLHFEKLTDYDCGRMLLTSRYYCPPCLTPDKSSPSGKPVEIAVTTGHTVTGKTVSLCEESNALSLKTNDLKLNGSIDATQFDITWYKDGAVISGPTTGSSSSVTNIKWSDIGSGNTATYVVRVTDHEKLPQIACPVYDTIYVVANPVPTVPTGITIPEFCAGSTPSTLPTNFTGLSVEWRDEFDNPVTAIPGTIAAGTHNYSIKVTSTATGCVSKPETIPVTVVANPPAPTVNNDVIYYRTHIQSDDTFKDLLAQDAAFLTKATGTDLRWSTDNGTTWGAATPVPPTPAANDFIDKTYTYQVKQKNTASPYCESQPATVTARIYLIPVPKVKTVSYCIGSASSQLGAPEVEVDPSGGYQVSDFQLRWYSSETGGGAGSTVSPTPPTTAAGEQIYWVSQYNDITNAESSRVPLKVYVYAKPVLTIADPDPVCYPATVNITTTGVGGVWNLTDPNASPLPVLTSSVDYFSGTLGSPTKLTTAEAQSLARVAAGEETYYIQAYLSMPDGSQCSSSMEPVKIQIHDLDPKITGNSKACPESNVTLAAVPVVLYNPGTPVYSWSRSDNGLTDNGSTFNTGQLPATPETIVTINLQMSQGACSAKSATAYTITIGNGQVIGTMTVFETDNAYSGTTYTDDIVRTFYSCGEEVQITTNYKADPSTTYTWSKKGGAVISSGTISASGSTNGINFTVAGARAAGNTTYVLKYINECETTVEIEIIDIPLKVVSLDSKITLCETDEFKAQLNITCQEDPTVDWYQNSSLVSSGKSDIYTIGSVTPANSGVYTYIVTNRGCLAEGTISSGLANGNVTQVNVSAMVTYNKIPAEAVCEGGQKEVGLYNVNPATTQLLWEYDNTIIGPNNQLRTIVEPTYNRSNNSSHRSTYTYRIKATNDYCSITIPIEIYVDEPLKGKIEDKTICEGSTTTLDASSYDASTYVWTSTAITGTKTTAEITESPTVTSYYYLSMTRGECPLDTSAMITVNSKPRIQTVDSIGPREREIIPASGYGTYPLSYGVDNEPLDNNPRKSGLLFTSHTFYIVDALGCTSNSQEYYLEAPKLFPPAHFSPNGDGYFDYWDVPGMREIYPDAIVTIYDRFGKKLIEYRGSAEFGWDGKYLGRELPTTDYWYEINIKEINKQYVGHFTLLRR